MIHVRYKINMYSLSLSVRDFLHVDGDSLTTRARMHSGVKVIGLVDRNIYMWPRKKTVLLECSP